MQCLNCGGQFEWAGGGKYARCTRCLSLFTTENGPLTPIVVQAPGGGNNPEFNAIFAQNLGFGPPSPGAGQPPPGGMGGGYGGPAPGGYGGPAPGGYGAPPPQHNMGAGVFDAGGGQQLHVKINGKTPENYLKDKASSMIWGWIIGAAILGLILLTFAGIGIYSYMAAKESTSQTTAGGAGPAPKAAAPAVWDGKTPFECSGNDAVAIAGVTATAGVKASSNCQLTLTGVTITAPIPIDASGNAKVTVSGGTITGSTNSAIASGNAKVDFVGTKVTGKAKQSANGKVTGAN
jgi:hypothetical protein